MFTVFMSILQVFVYTSLAIITVSAASKIIKKGISEYKIKKALLKEQKEASKKDSEKPL